VGGGEGGVPSRRKGRGKVKWELYGGKSDLKRERVDGGKRTGEEGENWKERGVVESL